MRIKLGFSIPLNVFDEGLSIAHWGTIVVNAKAHVGKNCRILDCVNIGAKPNGSPTIGDNVYIGSGAKIIGGISIADNVKIGAGAVVTHDIYEDGSVWAGVPARRIK